MGQPPPELRYASDAGPGAAPKLDRVLRVAPGNPLLLCATAGQELKIRLDHPGQEKVDPLVWQPLRAFDVSGEAEKGEVRWLRFWLIEPSGGIATSGAVPANRSVVIQASAAETGLYALMTESGPESLSVPQGLTEFEVATGGLDEEVHLKVFDAARELRFQRDDFNVHIRRSKVKVPAGQDGKVWSLALATDAPEGKRAGRRTSIELAPPLAGFVSPDPARLVLIE